MVIRFIAVIIFVTYVKVKSLCYIRETNVVFQLYFSFFKKRKKEALLVTSGRGNGGLVLEGKIRRIDQKYALEVLGTQDLLSYLTW